MLTEIRSEYSHTIVLPSWLGTNDSFKRGYKANQTNFHAIADMGGFRNSLTENYQLSTRITKSISKSVRYLEVLGRILDIIIK